MYSPDSPASVSIPSKPTVPPRSALPGHIAFTHFPFQTNPRRYQKSLQIGPGRGRDAAALLANALSGWGECTCSV